MRKLKAEQRSKATLHRPGKRQRADMKAEVFKTDGAKKAGPTKKAKKCLDTRGKKSKAQKAGVRKMSHKRKA